MKLTFCHNSQTRRVGSDWLTSTQGPTCGLCSSEGRPGLDKLSGSGPDTRVDRHGTEVAQGQEHITFTKQEHRPHTRAVLPLQTQLL